MVIIDSKGLGNTISEIQRISIHLSASSSSCISRFSQRISLKMGSKGFRKSRQTTPACAWKWFKGWALLPRDGGEADKLAVPFLPSWRQLWHLLFSSLLALLPVTTVKDYQEWPCPDSSQLPQHSWVPPSRAHGPANFHLPPRVGIPSSSLPLVSMA